MAYNVRIFGFRGMQQLLSVNPQQFSGDSIFQLIYPYEWAQLLSVSAAPVSSAPVAAPPAGDKTTILRVEVPDASSIRFEINPPGRNVIAGVNSPILSGLEQFYFRPGYSISMVDAAGLP